ncbi:MAG: PAS domain-containing protein, partial [Actinomycetota bacterium]|nr:PAS domain-containing protein [Actinomycetota bacterium]
TTKTDGALHGGEPYDFNHRIIRPNGTERVVHRRAEVVRDEGDAPLRMVGTVQDITERTEAEERIKASEAELRALFAAMNDVILVLDSEGRYLKVVPTNPSLLIGPPDDLVGKTLHEIFPQEQADAFLDAVQRALDGQQTVNIEYGLRIGERDVCFAASVSPMLEDQVIVVARDITERKQAEEALAEERTLLRTLIDNLPDYIYVKDRESRFVINNTEHARLLGAPEEELVGKTDFDVFPREHAERYYSDEQEVVLTGKPLIGREEPSVDRAGNRRWHSTTKVPLQDSAGGIAGLVGISSDITERKQAEEEIKEVNRRLEELAVLKADFTAMVAHELDTPLAVIRGYADMLATGELDPDGRERALAKLQAETDVMAALIADARHAAAIEREDFAVKPREVPVATLMKDAVAYAETLCGNHRLVIENVADGEVWADPHRIGQVLRNLLSNAAKYSPEGTPIELRTVEGVTPHHLRIEVADHGVGVHPDDVDRIFEKFGRGRDRSGRKVAGVGLGLYLSRRILQAHGSDLTLQSTPGGGCVFGFELEAAR